MAAQLNTATLQSSLKQSQCSLFGIPLRYTLRSTQPATLALRKRSNLQCTASLPDADITPLLTSLVSNLPADEISKSLFLGVGVGLPCHFMECGDVIYRSSLSNQDGFAPTVGGILLVTLLAAYLWSTPGVVPGIWDMFVLSPLERFLRKPIDKNDIILGKKLGEGSFGAVYMAKVEQDPEGEYVVKKATEFGAVETWMNERVRRACPNACADFVYGFYDKKSNSPNGGQFWLIWRYEGDSTLADLMNANNFPFNMEAAVLGKATNDRSLKRESVLVRELLRRILLNLNSLHQIGIVHRDVKPQNMIFDATRGTLKIIDLGAAADLRVGINYNPSEFLLDPRYCAPEQYIMSKQTPQAPSPPVAAILSPVLWQLNLPDRFDMFSAGLIFLQLVFPTLRPDNGLIQFNRQLKRCDYDLDSWRVAAAKRSMPDSMVRGFEMLDADNGAGWELAKLMLKAKAGQRVSAIAALAHPFLNPGNLPLLQRVRLEGLRLLYRDNSEITASLANFVSKAGTDSVGGFTEASLMEFRKRELRLRKGSGERNAKAQALKVQRKLSSVRRSLASSLASSLGKEDATKREAWWNRWQSE